MRNSDGQKVSAVSVALQKWNTWDYSPRCEFPGHLADLILVDMCLPVLPVGTTPPGDVVAITASKSGERERRLRF